MIPFPYQTGQFGRRLSSVGADPNFANVALLLHMDGTNASTSFPDSSSNTKTVTANGNAQVTTTDPKFGSGALLLDGAGDFLTTPNNTDYNIGTGDFTIEFFFKLAAYPASGNYFVLFDKQQGANTRLTFYLGNNTTNDSGLRASLITNLTPVAIGTPDTTQTLSALGINLNTWYHAAWTRSGTTVRLFLNGVLLGKTASDSGNATNTAQVVIGAFNQGASLFFNGSIDEFRITRGVARYTATFTPPAAPFPDS